MVFIFWKYIFDKNTLDMVRWRLIYTNYCINLFSVRVEKIELYEKELEETRK